MLDESTWQEITRWAVRWSVACYVVRVGLYFRRVRRTAPSGSAPSGSAPPLRPPATAKEKWVWAAGCWFYWFHMLLAFAWFHGWSHSTAVEFTAQETLRVVGVRRGEGVWVNYLFALVWACDCFAMAWGARYPKWLECARECFFSLIVFSATVVFGPFYYVPLSLAVLIFWAGCWWIGPQDVGGEVD